MISYMKIVSMSCNGFKKSNTSADVSSTHNQPLLHRDKLSSVYTEPYIITGYRKPGTTMLGSIKYAFVLHNDVCNFWTHFIPLLMWLCWIAWLAKFHIDFTDPYYYPLLCFWAGSCSYVFFSSMAHLLSNISLTVKSICFILDYLGIALYVLGGAISGFFYEQSVNSPFYKYQNFILTLEVALAIGATFLCGLTRFFWVKYRFSIRTLLFLLPYLSAVAPFAQRFRVCIQTGNQCTPETLPLHLSGFVFTLAIAFFFVTKIPERLAPGKFDIFFQSHTIFHVLAAIQTSKQMYMFQLDASLRREHLLLVEDAAPNFYNSILFFLIAEFVGLLIVGLFWVLIVKKFLKTNKLSRKED